jgi:hypothetical protein
LDKKQTLDNFERKCVFYEYNVILLCMNIVLDIKRRYLFYV